MNQLPREEEEFSEEAVLEKGIQGQRNSKGKTRGREGVW